MGVTPLEITIFMVVVVPHCPAAGVNVYVVVPGVAVLMVAGLHVPVILLVDVAGNDGAVLFSHNGPIWVNAGVNCAVITISIVAVVAPWPVAGVNV